MRLNLIFILLFWLQQIVAQPFILLEQTPSFTSVEYGSVEFADIDGDNDLDFLMTGGSSSGRITKLYKNDGSGNFTESMENSFIGLSGASIAFADIDGDNYKDLYISGITDADDNFAKLYKNDGSGNFTEVDYSFENLVTRNAATFVDIDNDTDQDLIIAGYSNTTDSSFTKLYMNDGLGNFTENTGVPFEGVTFGSIALADVDGDTDQDVVLSGVFGPIDFGGSLDLLNGSSKLYINDGSGNFTEKLATPFVGVSYAVNKFVDVDNDGDQDLLITGMKNGGFPYIGTSELYINDGLGNFTSTYAFGPVAFASIDFADIDGDGDQDAFVGGVDNFFSPNCVTEIFINDGTGAFEPSGLSPIDCIYFGAAAFADVDGDTNPDLFLSGGLLDNSFVLTNLYKNERVSTSVEFLLNDASFHSLNIYPNPANTDKVFIDYNTNGSRSITISVFDLNGRMLFQQYGQSQIGQNSQVIDIRSLTQGVYVVHLNDGVNVSSHKITIH